MIADPWFYVFAFPAVVIAGVSKGGFGGGMGVVAVPLMALVIPPVQAAAVMLPILCAMDIFTVWAYRRAWDRRHVAILVPAALIGIAVGTASFRYLESSHVKLLVGGVAVVFALDHYLSLRVRAGTHGPARLWGGLWGAVSGFTSFVAHAGGPPLSVYLLPQQLDKRIFVGTSAVFFICINYIKLFPYAWLGQFQPVNLTTSLVLLPLVPAGVGLGVWLQSRVSQELFYRVCYAMVLMTGVKLLWDGVAGLL